MNRIMLLFVKFIEIQKCLKILKKAVEKLKLRLLCHSLCQDSDF